MQFFLSSFVIFKSSVYPNLSTKFVGKTVFPIPAFTQAKIVSKLPKAKDFSTISPFC